MAPSLSSRLSDVHPQMLRAESESDRKKLVGRDVERSLALLGVSQKDAAFRMGYSDQGTVSRWCAGTERPHFDKLEAIEGFDEAWLRAKAERSARVKVRTVIEIQEKVG